MRVSKLIRTTAAVACASLMLIGLSACHSDDDKNVDINRPDQGLSASQINAPDGRLSATIRRTTGGVPHIKADNLESVAFGEGYVQAQDNVCIIADSMLRATGRRAEFYGPGPDDANVISDFSFRALRLLDKATQQFDQLSAPSKAILRGFAAGYDHYVDTTQAGDLPGKCTGASWVQKISARQLLAYYELIALYASGDQFASGATFAAAPPGVDPSPSPATASDLSAKISSSMPDFLALARSGKPSDLGLKTDYRGHDLGSNGWGIGSEMTENGRGALLANPHFPYTGNLRLYQSQMTVPGVYNVNGATLLGFAIPLIGFNEHVAWTHTVSTAQHFTFYTLRLADGDATAYIKDGQKKPITSRTFTIKVANGSPTPTTLKKTFYYSEYGPMIAANLVNRNLPAWGEDFAGHPTAFTYRDANADAAYQVIDQWLSMGRASNLSQFKTPFEACGSVLWTNTMYADDSGQAFYIDGTSVPNLSQAALTAYAGRVDADPVTAGLAKNGITLLDGSTSRDDWIEGRCDGRVPYDGMPKLARRDFVQNSNDSYWATNPAHFLTDYSPLYGPTESPLSPRTRMGLKMLEHPGDPGLSDVKPAGDDGKFTGEKIIRMLYSNRAYYPEMLLGDLLERCQTAGDTLIPATDDDERSIAAGCNALASWDGVYNNDSTGAQVFRVFIANYDADYTVSFDPKQPETTPSTPEAAPGDVTKDRMLKALAIALDKLDSAGIAYDTPLADIQYEQQSASVPPNGMPQPTGPKIPWPGTQNIEGGFNIVEPVISGVDEGTRFPRVSPDAVIPETGELSATSGQGWAIARGTSWHFGLSFTDDGPQAYGLVSYSESDEASSPHFSDQDERFSNKNYRHLLYSEADIADDPNLTHETVTATLDPSDTRDSDGTDSADQTGP